MSNTATTLDMRGQVMEVLCPKAAVVALADSVFREPIPVLVVAAELPAWLQRGSWIHVEGAVYFDAPPSIGGFTLEAQTIAAIPAEEWGGPEWVGAEEMLAPHVLTTQARVVTPWRYFDEPYYDEERVRGYAADTPWSPARTPIAATAPARPFWMCSRSSPA
jgi:hypothetical protein